MRNEDLTAVFHDYERQMKRPGNLREVIDWGRSTGQLEDPEIDVVSILMSKMKKALQAETSVDDQGREYRVNASVTFTNNGGIQESLWGSVDLNTTPRDFVIEHFAQRRKGIVDTCDRLKIDVDHFNGAQAKKGQLPLPLILDFTDDVAEREEMRKSQRDAAE